MSWVPRYSGSDRLGGCLWLGRLIDKARQYDVAGIAPGEMLGDYMFGNHDYLDSKLLRFLGMSDVQVSEIVRGEPSDVRAAERIVERSGKTAAQCAQFNRAFARGNAPFLAMIDADEGRIRPGLGASLLKGAYNALVFPLGIIMYRSAFHKRSAPTDPQT